jgi:hypothetical protein
MQQLRELLRQLLAVLSLRSPLKIVLRTRSKDRTAFGVVVRKTRRLDAEIGPPNHAPARPGWSANCVYECAAVMGLM